MSSESRPGSTSPDHATCPVTGLPVIRRPEWTDIQLDDNYSTTVEVIGGHILKSTPVGFATSAGVSKLNRLHREIIGEAIKPGAAYVHISDYTRFKGSSLEARRAFAADLKTREGLAALVCPQRSTPIQAFDQARQDGFSVCHCPSKFQRLRKPPFASLSTSSTMTGVDGCSHLVGHQFRIHGARIGDRRARVRLPRTAIRNHRRPHPSRRFLPVLSGCARWSAPSSSRTSPSRPWTSSKGPLVLVADMSERRRGLGGRAPAVCDDAAQPPAHESHLSVRVLRSQRSPPERHQYLSAVSSLPASDRPRPGNRPRDRPARKRPYQPTDRSTACARFSQERPGSGRTRPHPTSTTCCASSPTSTGRAMVRWT